MTSVIDSERIRELEEEGVLTIHEQKKQQDRDIDGCLMQCIQCGYEITIPRNEWPPNKCAPKSEGGCGRRTSFEFTSHKQKEKHNFIKYFKHGSESGKFLPRRLALDLLDEDSFITFKNSEEMYVFNDGVYHPDAECYIQRCVQDVLGDETTTHKVNEVVNGIMRETYEDRDIVCTDARYIPLKNGVYDLDEELLPHDPKRVFLSRLPVRYDPDADCPEIKQFLHEVLHDEDIELMQEICGYILYTAAPYDKITLFVGAGANGKSTWLNVLNNFYGQENLCNVPMRELANSRFAEGQLYGKLANIANEVAQTKDGRLKNTGTLKKIAGGDTIWSDRKWSKRGITFDNYAKLIFACNEAPEVTDDTLAWWRRMLILPFPYTFKGDEAKNREMLVQKMTTEEELSGFFNFCLEGLNRLLANDAFSYEASIEEVREQYLRISDSVKAFVSSECTIEGAAEIPKRALYNAYVQWCESEGLAAIDYNVFNRKLPKKAGGTITASRPKIRGSRTKVWNGITLVDVEKYDGLNIEPGQSRRHEPDVTDQPTDGGSS